MAFPIFQMRKLRPKETDDFPSLVGPGAARIAVTRLSLSPTKASLEFSRCVWQIFRPCGDFDV